MVKFCKNIILAISRTSSEIIPFPPHKLKKAEEYIKYKWAGLADIITIENKGFSLKFSSFYYKYYGCDTVLTVNHPQITKEKYGNKEHEFHTIIPTIAFSRIISENLMAGGEIQGTYSFDVMNQYSDSSRIIRDNSPEIPKRIEEYDRYYKHPKTSVLKLGGIYVNSEGYYYLSLTEPIYSKACGNGWSHEGYGLSRAWNVNTYSVPQKSVLMLFLGNNWDFIKSILSDENFDIFKFISDRIKLKIDLESLGSYYLSENSDDLLRYETIIRLKKHSAGSFVKVGEIESIKSLYLTLGKCYGFRDYLLNHIFTELFLNANKSTSESLSPANYSILFNITDSETSINSLSLVEKSNYRRAVINQIKALRFLNGFSYTLNRDFPEFLKPNPANKDNKIEDRSIEALFKCMPNLLKGTEKESYEDLINLGVFNSKEELINEIKLIMYGKSE